MKLAIHQPEHLPWLGFFNKMAQVDTYVILDDVQYVKGNYQNRNKILGTNGEQWISVPVQGKGRLDSTILDMQIAEERNPKWRRKYLNTLYLSYRNHPYFSLHFPFFEKLLEKNMMSLRDLNIEIIHYFADFLDIHPRFLKASELETEGKKSDLVLSICKTLGADTYLSGAGGMHYMNLEDFEREGIEVCFQNFTHPVYPQLHTEEFIPYLSTLDLLFNCDQADAKKYIL